MSGRAASAERLMVLEPAAGDHQHMDEDTIDCQWCGRPAFLETRIQELDQQANWRTIRKIIACEQHGAALEVTLVRLRRDERIVAQRCG